MSAKIRSDRVRSGSTLMAARHRRLLFALGALLVSGALWSCLNVAAPGIMPPIQDNIFSQWKVLNTEFLMIRKNAGPPQWQWQIIARFVPDQADQGLNPLDILATVDEVPVPFTFEEEGQIFESVTSFPLSPGEHKFLLTPSEHSLQPFPALMVVFEAP
ncbi:MAG: hypothetical protein RRA15_13100 [bacterium]|nr:hypothetical protein [bacterium]MDT8367398.1 hypothetical protein [bacterium]